MLAGDGLELGVDVDHNTPDAEPRRLSFAWSNNVAISSWLQKMMRLCSCKGC